MVPVSSSGKFRLRLKACQGSVQVVIESDDNDEENDTTALWRALRRRALSTD